MKKEIKKIIINFSDINKKCDSDFKKLSDKCKNYELSHNRKLRLLEKITKHWSEKKIGIMTKKQIAEHAKKWAKIVDEIKLEINAPLRAKTTIKIKMEPLIVPKMDRPFKPKDIFYWKGWKND